MQQPSEAEITMLVSLIHQKEIELSEFARDKAESPEVQRYAEQMIEEHSQAGQRGAELSEGGRINIEACSRCQQLEASSNELSESLEDQEGAEFDIAFIWAQVSFHRRALELLDTPSVASTGNARLRSHVNTTRADVEQHLREAEQLFCLLMQEQQQGGQQQRAQHGQQGVQQQGAQKQAQQQRGQQQGAQYGQQGVQQQGQQQGAQLGQQGVQQQGHQRRGQQQGAQLRQQGAQQQRGQQQEAQLGQQQRGQQQGSQGYAQQQGSQQGQQQGEPQKIR
ncbi:DUF4142 domain-containing protein [Sorangium sp. So ce1078]|uniref:DUF4142 domain-containing protein n=1 Tax=Sorangium sp. So ce1078 TaxID=3133329 RepID=UPI003F63FE2D